MFAAFNGSLFGLVTTGIVAILWFLGGLPVGERNLRDVEIWRRIVPLMPMILGVAIYVTLPLDLDGPWGVRALTGLSAGMAAAQGRKIIKRGFLDKLKERKDG